MKKFILMLLVAFTACHSTPSGPVIHIALANNNKTLEISGLDPVIMADVERDDSTSWQVLFPVHKMPADPDMKDFMPQQPGEYVLKDSVLVFKPDTAFVRGQRYFMRYNRFGQGKTTWDYIMGKTKAKETKYTDLIFKP